ncbi:tumor necrosis factor ligand superfamily member 13 isoform X2 [Pipistrellus kuhlii]|uniref:Tumor necrosis factor ligand superfamily member 13 n=1 Tax=Pipistrellus kuhlii TaxID=59472 RepID=A0A7J7TY89_PIPKU|nr:tumor necrosis factor ligand superfamily member 13 isoform X2 [Pipistrellus kuhlii]KAF6305562.1 TNF superfamily member 13 [Pipistrellus kuhlii]
MRLRLAGGGPGPHWPLSRVQEHRQCPSLLSSSLLFTLKFLFTSPLRNALLPSAPLSAPPVTHSWSHSCWQGPQLMPASSPSFPAPRGPPGDMGGRGREPALSVALWLSWGAALGAVACATALLIQQTELQILRREVAQLRRTGGPSERGEGHPWLSLQEQGPESPEAPENGERARRRRAVLAHKQKKRHSVLHLVPVNMTSKEDSDVTELMWQPALKRGRGLEAHGYVVRVWEAGVYLLYSQVLFHDVTFTMGQVVSREGQGKQETLFRCIRSMPSNPDWAYNSCYSAGVFHLHQGDVLSVTVPRARAKLSLSPHGTFLGFVKL